jgi:hypothetical protein
MIKFRWHRGSLEESLATTREFDSLMELKYYLSIQPYSGVSPSIFTIEYYIHDERCNQELFMVKLNGIPCGFIVEEYP